MSPTVAGTKNINIVWRRQSYTTLCVLVGLLLALPAGPVLAEAFALDRLAEQRTGQLLGTHMEFLHDPGGNFQLAGLATESYAWQPVVRARPNFGFHSGAHWLRFTLANPTDTPIDLILELPYPMLDDVRLYIPRASGTDPETVNETIAGAIDYEERRGGDRMEFGDREFAYHQLAFSFAQAARSTQTYYLRIATDSSVNASVRLWNPQDFSVHRERTLRVLAMLYAIFGAMLLFNTLLFFSLLERTYLYFTAYLVSITLFLFTLDGLAFQFLWPTWPTWANTSLPVFMCLSCTSGLYFARHYLRLPHTAPLVDLLVRGEIYLSIGSALAVLFLPYFISILLGTVLSSLVAATVLFITFLGLVRKQRDAYYFAGAWALVLAGVLLYSLKTFGVLAENFWLGWAIHSGVLLQLIFLSLGLADRINVLRLGLRRRLKDLRRAGQSLRASERKYKHLVESSGDIIFSLDTEGRFLTANKAIQTHLGLRAEDLIGTRFLSLLYRAPELEEILPGVDVQREIIEHDLAELRNRGKSIQFKAEFSTKLGEPRQLEVRMERVGPEPQSVLFGKAATVLEDSLTRFVEAERQTLVIGNFLNIADLITERMVKNLAKYIDPAASLGIHICLREMIINAIEHGNLAIDYETKTNATDRETYIQLLLARQKDPRFRDRKVTVDYSLNRRRVWYRIRDEGAGFDHRRLFTRDPGDDEDPNVRGLAHGRGITMARNVFDVVRYNEAGNAVSLIKRFDFD